MANIKSALKKNRQRIRHEARNMARKAAMRTAVKKVRAALAAKSRPGAETALAAAVRLIDRAAGRGVIKRRTASRTVSRLAAAVNALS